MSLKKKRKSVKKEDEKKRKKMLTKNANSVKLEKLSEMTRIKQGEYV